MAGEKHKTSSWVVVGLVVLASIVLAFAFVLQSVPLAVVGGVVLLLGMVGAVMFNVMEDVH